jgi:TIR domain
MRIFLSYATQQRALAEQIRAALIEEGYTVFFDQTDLPAGGDYHSGIREAVTRSHVFVFLVSPDSLEAGTYARTELQLAQDLGRSGPWVLPVMVQHVDFTTLPPALSEVTVLEPAGDVPAEILAQIERFGRRRRRRRLGILAGAGGIAGAVGLAVLLTLRAPVHEPDRERVTTSTLAEAERVALIASATNQGWLVTFDIAEPHVREVRYQLDGEGEFRSTGVQPSRDRETGLPLPVLQVTLPSATAERDIAVRYTDAAGRERGPFHLRFDPKAAFLGETRRILDMVGWVSFREFPKGHLLVYFTPLLGYKNAFAAIRYSVDDESLAREVRFTPDWTRGALAPMRDDDEAYVEIPLAASFVAVRLRFTDGTESALRRFPISDATVDRG